MRYPIVISLYNSINFAEYSMRIRGTIIIRGIVQGSDFVPLSMQRPGNLGSPGPSKSLGARWRSMRSVTASRSSSRPFPGNAVISHRFQDVQDLRDNPPDTFTILESGSGSLSGFIPADIGTCDDCIADMFTPGDGMRATGPHPASTAVRGTASSLPSPTTGSGRRWRSFPCAAPARAKYTTRPAGGTTPRRSPVPPAGRNSLS